MNSPRQPIQWKKRREGRRGQDRPHRVALLQDAGEGAAALLGQRLKGQRRAHAPLAAHGQPKQRAQRQQHRQRGRKGAGQLDHREAENIRHQHRPPPIAVGQHAEQQSAHRAEGLGQKNRAQHRRRHGVELPGNGLNAEDQQKEVQRIHRPAQEGGHKGVPLRAGQLAEGSEHGHRREDNRRLGGRSAMSRSTG